MVRRVGYTPNNPVRQRKRRAMLDRAVAALKTEFKATALSEFNDKNNKQFHDRDLYVFCIQHV